MDPTIEAAHPALRQALSQITAQSTGNDVARQIPLVAALAEEYDHAIVLVQEAIPEKPETFRHTCFQHAFELVNPPRLIVDIATLYPDVYPNADFVGYLIEGQLFEVPPSDIQDDDVVVYFEAGIPRHAGKIHGGLIVSKWGTAHYWKHRLWEVPATYGSEVRFFRPIERKKSEIAFVRFAERELGISFLGD